MSEKYPGGFVVLLRFTARRTAPVVYVTSQLAVTARRLRLNETVGPHRCKWMHIVARCAWNLLRRFLGRDG